MAVHYFPFSQDFNDDAEGWELTDTFGDRALRTWNEVLGIMDRTNNWWKFVPGWESVISRKVRQSPATVRRTIGWMLAKHWLEVGQLSADGQPEVLRLRNYAKYRKLRAERNTPPNNQPNNQTNIRENAPPNGVAETPLLPGLPPATGKKKKQVSDLLIPDWLTPQAWTEYQEHRIAMHQPLTVRAAELTIKQLTQLRDEGNDPTQVIEQSIMLRWRGLFPVKHPDTSGKEVKEPPKIEREENGQVFLNNGKTMNRRDYDRHYGTGDQARGSPANTKIP